MIKKILLSLIICIQLGYTQDNGKENIKSILMDKPFYMMKIDAVNAGTVVTLNGEIVFSDFTTSQKTLEVPVNQFMHSGTNTIKVYLMIWEKTVDISRNTEAKISLRLKKSEDFSTEPMTLNEMVYVKGDISKSTISGNYNTKNNFNREKEGDISISEMKTKILNGQWTTEDINGVMLEQNITIETPFPRWKFLDSEELYKGNFLLDIDLKNYKTLKGRKDIEEVYKLHKRIYDALQNKDIDWVVNLFSERNSELETALYKPKGYYEDLLKKRFLENVNNTDMEMLPFIIDKAYFYISPGGKTLYIRNAIVFNYKDGGGSSSYNILFRKQDGKWILTR